MYLESNERALDTVTIIRLIGFTDYDFNSNPGIVHYELVDYKEVLGFNQTTGEPILNQDGTQAFSIFKTIIDKQFMPLTWEVVNAWGSDDQVVFDYIIENLPK